MATLKLPTDTVAEYFHLILYSPTIFQCRFLFMANAYFLFKYYKVLYAVKVIEMIYDKKEIDRNSLQQFLEQQGVKHVVVFNFVYAENVDYLANHLSKAFFSAVSPNAFKIVFLQDDETLTEFRKTNNISDEILEFKKGFPVEYQDVVLE